MISTDMLNQLLKKAQAATPTNKLYLDNFLSKIKASKTGCLEWTASLRGHKRAMYGCFWNGKQIAAHQFSYEAFIGRRIKGMFICHSCDNPKCVNPDHLFQGTPKDNVLDCMKKNRWSNGESKKTHCPSGHPYIKSNTYRYRNTRQCKTCRDIHRKRVPKKYYEINK